MNFMRFLTLGYLLGSILLAILSALYGYFDVGAIEIEYLYVPFKFVYVYCILVYSRSLSLSGSKSLWNFMFLFVKWIPTNLFRLPWNQHTVRGWIGETVFSVISSSLYLFTNVVFLTFFIGICEFHRAFLQYFVGLTMKIENSVGNDGRDMKTKLCDIINFHIAIKRFVWNFFYPVFPVEMMWHKLQTFQKIWY